MACCFRLLADGRLAATFDPVLIPLTRLVTLERTLLASERMPLTLFIRAETPNISLVPANMLARLLSLALAMVRIAVNSSLVSRGPPMEVLLVARERVSRFYTSAVAPAAGQCLRTRNLSRLVILRPAFLRAEGPMELRAAHPPLAECIGPFAAKNAAQDDRALE